MTLLRDEIGPGGGGGAVFGTGNSGIVPTDDKVDGLEDVVMGVSRDADAGVSEGWSL